MRSELLAEVPPWNLTSFFDKSSEFIRTMGGTGIILFGVISLIWGGVLLMKKLMSVNTHFQESWAKVVLLIATGSALCFGGVSLIAMQGSEKKDASTENPTPSPSSTPSTTPTPEPEPTQEPADPISLPKIENTETIFIVLGIILVALIIGFIAYRMVRSVRRHAIERKEEEAQADKLRQKWNTFVRRAGTIKAKIYEAETDWDMLFNFPALADVSIPATAKLYKTLRDLDMLDQEMPSDITPDTDLTQLAYPKTLLRLEAAWDAAFAHARRIGNSVIPAEERKKVEEIKRLLSMAMDPGSTDAERSVAYNRAHKLIKQLRSIVIPEKAFMVLEKKNQLMIEGANTTERELDPEELEAREWRQRVIS